MSLEGRFRINAHTLLTELKWPMPGDMWRVDEAGSLLAIEPDGVTIQNTVPLPFECTVLIVSVRWRNVELRQGLVVHGWVGAAGRYGRCYPGPKELLVTVDEMGHWH